MERLIQHIDNRMEKLAHLASEIWDLAEVGFYLEKSADLLSGALKEEGFQIERGIAQMKDAFIGTFGNKGPVIGILGEYDALPSMNQVAGSAQKEAFLEGAPGHGCGHHILGTAGIGAALGLKAYLEEEGLAATIKYFGCPAEEGGSGKAFMARDGIFDGVDAFVTWHPMEETRVWSLSTLANTKARFTFKGKSAHAAFVPHLGCSALDACELMNVGVNYLREHLVPEARLHYAYLNAGGQAPNIVQDYAQLYYYVRAPKSTQVKEIFERVANVAKGAALMTGTEVTIEMEAASMEFLVNETLAQSAQQVLETLGEVPFNEEDLEVAAKYQATLSESERSAYRERLSGFFPDKGHQELEALSIKPLLSEILPLRFSATPMFGSTDVGDASWCAPCAQITTSCYPAGTAPHTWQWVAFGKESPLFKGMVHASKAMAMIALDMIKSPPTLEKALEEFSQKTGNKGYQPLIALDFLPEH